MKNRVVILSIVFCLAAAAVFAEGGKEATTATQKMKEYSFFIGYPKEDYPANGTIFGDWLEKKTGVKIKWEFVVGDLRQKAGIMAASGDYPDAMNMRNENQTLLDAGAFVPLNDLVAKNAPNIQKLYGKRVAQLYKPDGKLYWFPQLTPYGDSSEVRTIRLEHGVYVQYAVLKDAGFPDPRTLTVEKVADMLIAYAKKHPTINGNKTYAWTALTFSWQEFPLYNAPSILSGHPNDGAANVDFVNGKWVATQYYDSKMAYQLYKVYNKINAAGLYDPESFVMNYDQYLAKLTTGSILAFYDQYWQFEKSQTLLLDQNQDHWYVPLPIVLDGYKEEFNGPIQSQVSEGLGISTKAKDPAGIVKYLDSLADIDTQIIRSWGFKDTDYLVDSKGLFYRNQEQIDRWKNLDWRQKTFGAWYWDAFLRVSTTQLVPGTQNAFDPENQPSVAKGTLRPGEIEALKNYKIEGFYEWFRMPDARRELYFPAWTIKQPTGSQIQITHEKIMEARRKYTPMLIQANPADYDKVWNEFLATIAKIPEADRKEYAKFYQDEIDLRVKAAGGYR